MEKNRELIDVMIDVLAEIHQMRIDFNKRFESMDKRFESMDKRFESIEKRIQKLEKNQAITNRLLSEHTRSIMRLADELRIVPEHEKRIQRLENKVFNKPA